MTKCKIDSTENDKLGENLDDTWAGHIAGAYYLFPGFITNLLDGVLAC